MSKGKEPATVDKDSHPDLFAGNTPVESVAVEKAAGRMPSTERIREAQAQSLDQFIMRAAADHTFDVEKLERLLALRKEMETAQRKERFFDALALAQAQMPQLDQNGLITYTDRETGRIKGSIPYAKLEDIDAVIRPIYSPLGFSVSWNTESVMDGKGLRVIGTFSAHGHSETRAMTGPNDASGGKNGIQGVASANAYLKRQITKNFWNLVERGKDLDGARAKDLLPITQGEADDINTRLTDCGADLVKFKKLFSVEKIADLKHGQLKEVYAQIEAKERAKAK
jgi:hypothetical protein